MSTLEEVVAELYGLALDDFTPRRSALAKELRAEDKELADAVSRLPKPARPAWALNAYARERADELDDLLALGEQLREAQRDQAGDRLKALAANATTLVRRTVKGVAAVAADAGAPLSDTLLGQVEQTLRAAMANPDAAAVVQAGALAKPLAPAGFGPADLSGAAALVPAARPARERRLTVVRPSEEERRQTATREVAEKALQALERAEAELSSREDELNKAEDEHASALARRDELRAALKDAEREEQAAARRAREAAKAKERAATQVTTATMAAARAKKAVGAP